MQHSVIFLNPLVPNIFRDTCLISELADRVHKISIRPEFSSPQFCFHFRMFSEYFSGCDTFYHPDNLIRTFHWNGLNQKMNMIFVSPNLQKVNFIPLLNFKTDGFHRHINSFAKNHSSILSWTNKMVQEYRNIVRFMYVFAFAHTHKDIKYAASSGELTPKKD